MTVYANTNYRGQSATFHNDTPNLVSFNLNDKVSSIRIPNGETWEVCQDINYESQCEVLSASVTDLGRNGWGDRISSLRRVNDRGFGNRQTGHERSVREHLPARLALLRSARFPRRVDARIHGFLAHGSSRMARQRANSRRRSLGAL